jgi:hypothetical protein
MIREDLMLRPERDGQRGRRPTGPDAFDLLSSRPARTKFVPAKIAERLYFR